MLNIGIRADGSTNIGMGHIMRCLSLAKGFRDAGAKVYFMSRYEQGIYFEQYTNFFERPHLYKPQEDGESFEELLVRVRNAWDEIIKAGGNNVLIVTHAVVLKTI